MRLSELILKRKVTRFSSAIPLLLHIYMDAHNWNADDYIGEVYQKKRDYVIDKVLVLNIKNKNIAGHCVYKSVFDDGGYPFIDEETGDLVEKLDLEKSDVDLIGLIQYLVKDLKDISIIPGELLIAAGIEPPTRNTSEVNSSGNGEINKDDVFYEDVISDETILKLMDLPLPKMKQQVAMLAAEKKKTDAAVMAAAKIGLLFCEERLQKPANEKLFVTEYKKHLDKFPALHDTTIKRIYKNLPDGYRFTRDGGQAPCDHADMRPVIKAAALAGSMANIKDSMNIGSLKKSLSVEQYVIPPDDILEAIIAAVKNLEIEEDD